MCHKFFQISGLSIVLATLVVVQSTAVWAADGSFRSRVNSMAAGADSNSGAQVLDSAASQYQSSPAAGPVVSRSAGDGQSQGKSNFTSRALSLRNNFATQSNVIAAPNGNTGYTGTGLPKPQRINKVIAAPNGNSGITGAGLPQPSAQTGVMYRNVVTAPSVDMQAKQNKLAGSVPMPQTQKGVFGALGGALDDAVPLIGDTAKSVGNDIDDAFNDWAADVVTHGPLPPDKPEAPTGPQVDVTTSKLPSKMVEVVPNATTDLLPSKVVTQAPKASTSYNRLGRAPGADQVGNGQGTPSTPAPAPTPAPEPAPTQKPGKMPQFPIPMPYPSRTYPSGPVVISRPAPVIVSQPATQYATPVQAVETAATSIDLVLEDLTLESPATLIAGPAYRLKFRNQGSQAAGSFQVAILVGLEGKLANDAPRGIVEVPSLAAGQVAEVTLRLPIGAMKMVSAQAQATTFTHLFVAVDFMNSLAELDESNNQAIVERSALDAAAQ